MSHVYTGIWNEDLPEGTRHHLTVSDSNAFVILTVVALMIEFAVMSCWFESYPFLRRLLPRRLQNLDELKRADGVTPSIVLVSLVLFLWRERHVRDDRWRCILLGMWSGMCVIAALGIPIAAAWFLTYGTMETPTVKASGSTCNMVIGLSRSQTTLRNINLTLAASEYFQSCYLRHTLVSCQSNLAQDSLDWVDSDASCPFAAGTCLETANIASVRLETPLITMDELAINAPTELRLKKAMTCSVIRTESFRGLPASELEGVKSTLVFGSSPAFEYDVRNLSMVAPGYRLTTIAENVLDPDSLDARLRIPDGFVTVILLQAPDVYFSEPMDDSMFSAHQENNFPSGLRWSADNLINAAACVDQYLVCNNGTGVCTSWSSPEEVAATSLLPLGLLNSNADQRVWNILQYVLTSTSVHYTIYGRGSSALLAQRSLFSQNQESLGSQPWRDELNGWFGVSLAKLQLSVHALARPTPFLPLDDFQAFPPSAGTLQLCKMVKFREGSYTNIHWPGFIATMVVCGLLGLIHVSLNVFRTWKIRPPTSSQPSGSPLANSAQSPGHGSPPIPLTPLTSQQQGGPPIPMTPQAGPPPPTPPSPQLASPLAPSPTPGSPTVLSPSPSPSPPVTPSPVPLSPQMATPAPPAPSSLIGLP